MSKQLVLKPEKCVNCRTCELVCSFTHFEQFSPRLSAVTVFDFEEDVVTVPIMCLQCDEPACEKICPVKAISRDDKGMVVHDINRCIGCKLCTQACSMGNISYLPQVRRVFKCDLCGGEPACAAWCPPKAIVFADTAEEDERKKAIAAGLKDILIEEVA